ncbi:hypothetical protein GCM10023184_28310 [Flaviaesturariibacter amylovorans]|uniref:Uncharacterized protein n=1 Tax=Flaviaesturariibacter amylovorans TaxID=1084520 RepID=A0ABP8H578_9BACT
MCKFRETSFVHNFLNKFKEDFKTFALRKLAMAENYPPEIDTSLNVFDFKGFGQALYIHARQRK